MYERELICALAAARKAATFLRPAFGAGYTEELDVPLEGDLRRHLLDAFPDYGYTGEETPNVIMPRDAKEHLWLVDPHDGTQAAARGHRGAAVSIALLRNGLPVLGVVYAYSAPDDDGDLFWWAEGHGPLRRNEKEITREWKTTPLAEMTVLMSQDADGAASVNAAVAHPMRFRGIPGIAYRLALVAAGEGDLAISLNSPTGWDVAGGHALLRGAGGDLFGPDGSPVKYSTDGYPNVSLHTCFGGSAELVQCAAHREWRKALHQPNEEARKFLEFLKPGKTVTESGVLARAHGCLLGQFAGDALGSLVEFQSPGEIRSRYPDGPRLLEDGGTWSTIAGQPTDDSELALTLARSIVAKHQYREEEAATAYAQWYDSHPFDIGNTTSLALDPASLALQEGKCAMSAAQAHASRSSQANGALMRVSPLAIFGAALEPNEIARFARADAGLTHPHEVCRAANAVFAVAISYAIRTGCNAQQVYRYARAWAHDNLVDSDVLESLEAAKVEVPRNFTKNQGWVRVAFQNAFYQLLHAPNLEEGVVKTVRSGGDTDTNAAIAGALLGAVHGRRAIPAQWMDRVLTCRPIKGLQGVLKPRPSTYWTVDALALAERLVLAGRYNSHRRELPVGPNSRPTTNEMIEQGGPMTADNVFTSVGFDKSLETVFQRVRNIIESADGCNGKVYKPPRMRQARAAQIAPGADGRKKAQQVFAVIDPRRGSMLISRRRKGRSQNPKAPWRVSVDAEFSDWAGLQKRLREWSLDPKLPRNPPVTREFGDGISIPGGLPETNHSKF